MMVEFKKQNYFQKANAENNEINENNFCDI